MLNIFFMIHDYEKWVTQYYVVIMFKVNKYTVTMAPIALLI